MTTYDMNAKALALNMESGQCVHQCCTHPEDLATATLGAVQAVGAGRIVDLHAFLSAVCETVRVLTLHRLEERAVIGNSDP